MPVPITCPECDSRFKVKNELAGGKVRCPKCAAVLTVADEEAAAPRRPDRGEGTKPRGKARKKAASGWGLLIGLGVGGGVLVLLLGLGVVGLTLYLRQSGKVGSDTGLPS